MFRKFLMAIVALSSLCVLANCASTSNSSKDQSSIDTSKCGDSCERLTITDPESGYWEYEYIKGEGGSPDKTVNLTYVSQAGTRTEGLYATTGFFNTKDGPVAIVASCARFNNDYDCREQNYGVMSYDGKVAPSFGQYKFPDIVLNTDNPARIYFENYAERNSKGYSLFPMWKNYMHNNSGPVITNYAKEGLIVVYSELNDGEGYIDIQGNIVVEPKYHALSSFSGREAFAVNENFVLGKINRNGIFTPDKYACMTAAQNGLMITTTQGQIGSVQLDARFRNYNGFIYQTDTLIDRNKDDNFKDAFCVHGGNTYGAINQSGDVIIPNEFSALYVLSNGSIMAQKDDGYYGYYAANGIVLVEPIFKKIVPANRSAVVYNEFDKAAICTSVGCNTHTDFIYSDLIYHYTNDSDGFYFITSNYIGAKKNDKWGVLSLNGNEQTAFEYDSLTLLRVGKDAMLTKKGGKFGLVNNGIEVYPPKFDAIGDFDAEGKAMAREGNEDVYIFLEKELEQDYNRNHAPRRPMYDGRNHRRY